MDHRRWRRVQAIFDAALEKPPAEREPFLARECGADGELRRDVDALLAAADPARDYFDRFAEDVWGRLAGMPAGSLEGRRIGPYRVTRLLGCGGMGAVYLAERADGEFEQVVALKLVPRGVAPELVERFRLERQILARLQHPNIATLLGGGLTDEGQPYLVMQYVEGVPVTEYCDRERLTVPERLRLFLTICDAVRYAHRNLVLHRDLKPSNILVNLQGRVKLLDFGIGKLLEDGESGGAALTSRTSALMTPEYASPEQIRGEANTTASDVYQLGVVLYELLTGTRPHAQSGRTAHELRQAILEAEPPRPSGVAGEGAGKGASADRLRRRLRGDLDNILLKALERDPGRRYASVDALADDLRRHLDGLPVRARSDTFAYRTSRFLRRRWRGVAAAVALLMVAASALAAHTVRITRERDRAQRSAAFLVDLIRSPDPYEGGDRDVRVRDVLDRGMERVLAELPDDPALQVDLLLAMASTYENLSIPDRQLEAAEAALPLAVETHGHHTEIVASLHRHASAALTEMGRDEEAMAHSRLELDIIRRLHPEGSHALGLALNNIGWTLDWLGEREEARRMLRESVSTFRSLPDDPDARRDLIYATENLARVLRQVDSLDAALALQREALAIAREVFPPGNPGRASRMANLGIVLLYRGDYEESERFLREALRIYDDRVGESHSSAINTRHALATTLDRMGRHVEAERLHRRLLELKTERFGPRHERTALGAADLSSVLVNLGRYDEAEAMARRAADIYLEVAPDDLMRGVALLTLSDVRAARGRYPEAEAMAKEAAAIFRAALPERHWRTAMAEARIGEAVAAAGRVEEARAFLARSLDDLERTTADPPLEEPRVRAALAALGDS